MKNKVINTALCDAREVKEENLQGFEDITVNAACLIVNDRAKDVLNRYPVTLNVASTIEIPEDIRLKIVNGKEELGPDADGKDLFLLVNGSLTIRNGSLEAANSYSGIQVNGRVLMPESDRGKVRNLNVNGETLYYPDEASLLKPDTEIDRLFLARATHPFYHCPGWIFFLDTEIKQALGADRKIRFSAEKIIIDESLISEMIPRITEETEIICVPSGTRLIQDDLELKKNTVQKFGSKLFVCGDVTIHDEKAISGLDYLYATGTVRVDKTLEEAFEKIESHYEQYESIDPEAEYLYDRISVRVGSDSLIKNPAGIYIKACAKVILLPDLSPTEIRERIHISDCALVCCNREQEDSVRFVSEDVAVIELSDKEKGEENKKETKALTVNAAQYRL